MDGVNFLCAKKESYRLQMAIYLVAPILILFFWHIYLQREIDIVVRQEVDLQKELVAIYKPFSRVKKFKGNVGRLIKRRKNFFKVFGGILGNVSKNMYLSKIVIKASGIKISGKTNSIFSLTRFIKSLSNVGFCNLPVIQKIENKENGYHFFLLWECGLE